MNLPILTATGIPVNNAAAINNLLNGQAGSLANTLATNRDFFCRMVGTSFEPCGTSYGAGAGYPINFWRANPFATGAATTGRQWLLQLQRPAGGVPSAPVARHVS